MLVVMVLASAVLGGETGAIGRASMGLVVGALAGFIVGVAMSWVFYLGLAPIFKWIRRREDSADPAHGHELARILLAWLLFVTGFMWLVIVCSSAYGLSNLVVRCLYGRCF